MQVPIFITDFYNVHIINKIGNDNDGPLGNKQII